MLQILITLGLVGSSFQVGILPDTFVPIHLNQQDAYQKPPFCHNLDCPKYTVLETNEKFETRRYEPSVWVATELYTMVFSQADSTAMFFKLFHYISGNNSAHMKIDMTAPVVTEIVHGPGPDCESNFTMHFMIPFDLQMNPPQPTENGVFIKHVPEMTVYVRSYGGYDTEDKRRMNIEQLVTDLNASNKPYQDAVFLTAGYDGPYAVNRHNEIWIVAK